MDYQKSTTARDMSQLEEFKRRRLSQDLKAMPNQTDILDAEMN
jgi:hypothetical protein